MAKGYLGPAAQTFLSGELHALGVNANTVTSSDIVPLAARVREHAARVMGATRASELADALARCDGAKPVPSGHRLAADAAAKLLAGGKLRQAEKAYVELVRKHGDLGSYTGLARTQAALEDVPAALASLREGAARFARANDRASAVSLLAEAVSLAPTDLAAHRRLAAALANQGDLAGAVEEYGRFVDVALATGDSRRALLELAYGRETLGDLSGLLALVDRVAGAHSRTDAPQPPARRASARPAEATPPVAARPAESPARAVATPPPAAATPLAAATTRPAANTAVVLNGAQTVTHVQPGDLEAPVDMLARAGIVKRVAKTEAPANGRPKLDIEQQLAALMTTGEAIDAATMAASRAALLTGAHDPRATEAVLDAARRLLALGKLQSASDVLLDFIGHGFTDREAQRLLIEVDCALGRRDVAREKCALLSHAYRLDGRSDIAEDVERLARIL